jgi:predicted GNAT family acetyltransferase
MLKQLDRQRLQQIVDFIKENYDNAPHYLFPDTVEELLENEGSNLVFGINKGKDIVAICFATTDYPTVSTIYRTVVKKEERGNGWSKQLDEAVEKDLKDRGVKKVQSYIYTNNFPSIFRRLKRGFLVEGLTRNQDGNGKSTYIMGKEL